MRTLDDDTLRRELQNAGWELAAEKIKSQAAEIEHLQAGPLAQLCARQQAEITRLRAALEVFADSSLYFSNEPRLMRANGPCGDNPAEFARRALEGK